MNLFKNIDKDKILYQGLILTFSILYAATAFVSWYHSITFFNIANAVWLSVILSLVAEIGQASVLFSILLTSNKNSFLPWFIMIILTTLQIIGNVVSSYKFIVVSNSIDYTYFQKSILFWVQTPNVEMFKVIIAWISGGILPVIALAMTTLVANNLNLKNKKEIISEVSTTESDATLSADLDKEVENLTVSSQFEKELILPENEKSTNDKPAKPKRGWHLKKKFVDSNGDIYSYGKLASTAKPKEPKKA